MWNKCGWLCLSLVATGALLQAQEADRVTVPFSDPARPRSLRVSLLGGAITVRGYAGNEAIIEAGGRGSRHRRRERPNPKAEGLRRLDGGGSGLKIEEQDNVVTVSAGPSGDVNLDIQVPFNTSLRLKLLNDGDIRVENVSGEIDANNLNGNVILTNVSGSVVAHSLNDNVTATFDKVAGDKPMSFSTMNGDVDVTLPADVKARVKMKTDNGEIYTDFDIRLEAAGKPVTSDNRKSGGKYRIQFDKALYGSINGGGPEMQFTSFNGKIYLRKKK